MRLLTVFAAAAIAVVAAQMAGAQEPSPDALAVACSSCHGVDGKSTTAIPAIAGTSAADLMAALTAFRSGERTGTIMNRIAKGYSDAQIAALAAHFSQR